MHTIAAVKHSCESILESFVSEYENHFDECRNVNENKANEESTIAVNGPNLAHADSVILQAMDFYWQGKPWHFYIPSVKTHQHQWYLIYTKASSLCQKQSSNHGLINVVNFAFLSW